MVEAILVKPILNAY